MGGSSNRLKSKVIKNKNIQAKHVMLYETFKYSEKMTKCN